MARYTGPACRLCRAESQKLFLKGTRCFSEKCSITRKPNSPGQHGQNKKKLSEYGQQLRSKQRVRRFYGVLESQFRRYYDLALKVKEGKTGENMLAFLEFRLDNVIYQLGWGTSRRHARQLLLHGHFLINNRKVNIPSYLVRINDVVSLSAKGKKSEVLKGIIDKNSKSVPKWLEFTDKECFSAKILAKPERVDIPLEVNETLIVELLSK